MTEVILISLVSTLAFGISSIFQKISASKVSPVKLITMRGIGMIAVTFIAALLSPTAINITPTILFMIIFIATIIYLGLFYLNKALVYEKAGIVFPLSSGRIVLTSVISYYFLDEKFSLEKLVLLLIIMIGIALLSINVYELKERIKLSNNNLIKKKNCLGEKRVLNIATYFKLLSSQLNNKGILFTFINILLWGISFPFLGKFSNIVGVFIFTFLLEFIVTFLSIVHSAISNKSFDIFPNRVVLKKSWYIFALVGFTAGIGSITSNFAYSKGYESIVTAVVASNPLITITIGRYVLKENITKLQIVGALLIISGIIFLTQV